VNRFSEKTKRIIAIVNYSIILIFLVALVFFGIKLSIFSRSRVFQGIPGFSYSWVSMSVPVGSFLQIITVVLKLKRLVSVKGRAPVESEA
jgi:TRAP-type C4-dicarboxylate transport system permease small subunit